MRDTYRSAGNLPQWRIFIAHPLDFGGFPLRAAWMPLTVRQSSVSLPENCREIAGKMASSQK